MNQQECQKLEHKIYEKLSEQIADKSTIILALSGGPDSIFLFSQLLLLQSKLTFHLIAAHLNHGIRGGNADREEEILLALCANLANKHQISFLSKKVDIKKMAENNKKSLEEMGRYARYKFLESLAKKVKASKIITAHHATDNLETIILNFTRGSGLSGLRGMETLNTIPYQSRPSKSEAETQLFRPLLDISKSQILAYLKVKKIPYFQDLSNADQKFSRNFVRHTIVPKLQKLNPALEQTIAKNSENLREIANFLSGEALLWLKKNTDAKTGNTGIGTGLGGGPSSDSDHSAISSPVSSGSPSSAVDSSSSNSLTLNLKNFQKLDPAIKKQVLREIYKKFTKNLSNLETVHIEDTLKMIMRNIGNKEKKMGKLIVSIKNRVINFHLAKSGKK